MEIYIRHIRIAFILTSWLLLFSLGCSKSNHLMIFSAASLKEPLSELAQDFRSHENVELQFTFAGSITLSNQIKRGMPADVFISAGEDPMNMITSTNMVNLLTNQLVVIVPKDRQINGSISEVLASSKRIAIADPKLAPAGKYSKEALSNMGLWESLKPKFVFGGNVKTALAWVNFGNADAGIVYLTDTFKNQNVKIVSPISSTFHSPITYSIVILDASEHKDSANYFIDFLQSPSSQKVFEKYGFGIPE